MYDETGRHTEFRVAAVKRLKKRRDFHGHLLIYAPVNTFLAVHLVRDLERRLVLLADLPDGRLGYSR